MVKAIPDGFHTVTPYLRMHGAREALDLYVRALGAENLGCLDSPDGKTVLHAMIQIGSSRIFLSDPMAGEGLQPAGKQFPFGLFLYVEDVDSAYRTALAAGLTGKSSPEDMFWGDRVAVVGDPYGFTWTLATHVREVSSEELREGALAFSKR